MKLINIFKLNKDKKEFEKQVSLIYEDLYKFIYSMIKNSHLTEDIFQETLMKAYEQFHTIKNIKKFKSWIFTIAKNESLAWIKRYSREISSEIIPSELMESFSEDVPEVLLLRQETKQQVKECIKILKPVEQEIMYLRYYYDLTLNEIALILNLNENTVKTKHVRAKKKIYTYISSPEVATATLGIIR